MALGSGAEVFTTSVNGIGERTGNAPMHQVLLQLRYLFGIEIPHFKYEKLRDLARHVERVTGIPVQPTEPVIGLNVFTHEAVIHIAGMLIRPAIYQFIPPADMGAKVDYVYGKHSGAVVIEHALREAGIRPEPELVAKVLREVKRVREERAERADFSDFHRSYYEHLGQMRLRAVEEWRLAVFAEAGDPLSAGRNIPGGCYSDHKLKIAPVSQVVAAWIPKAAGIAYASKLSGDGAVTLCTFGDGATSQGDFHEGVNFAAAHKLPAVFVCENNGYAISVPIRLQMANPDVADRARGYGILCVTVDGTDVPAAYAVCKEAVERARRGEGPTLIDAKIWRINAHTSEDNQLKYRSQEEVTDAAEHDPLERFRSWLVERGWIASEDADRLQGALDQEASDAADWAEQQPDPVPEDALTNVFA